MPVQVFAACCVGLGLANSGVETWGCNETARMSGACAFRNPDLLDVFVLRNGFNVVIHLICNSCVCMYVGE